MPAKRSGVSAAGLCPLAFSPCRRLPSHTIANRSLPRPLPVGSTTVRVIAAASAASTALPPASSMRNPACAARGWEAATTFWPMTGMRPDRYGEL